jgi:DNA polymerase-3 subunit delta
MRGASTRPELRAQDIRTGYLFHGDEPFAARQFIDQVKALAAGPDGEAAVEERFSLAETRWRDIIDSARNVPFFFSPWRLMIVEVSKAAEADLDTEEEAALRAFFSAPVPQTILFVLFAGTMARSKGLFKLFESLPASVVEIEEMKPLKNIPLATWINEKTAAIGKRISPDGVQMLQDIVGNDLSILDSELEKLATYAGAKPTITGADVQAVSGWAKDFAGYDLTDALEEGKIGQALLILHRWMADGGRGDQMIGTLAGFLRSILLARSGLRQGRDRREIFGEIRPGIKESFKDFYLRKFQQFFAAVEGLTENDFVRLTGELERLDMKLKTSDADPKALLEAFFYDFCRAVRRPGFTSKARG